MAFYRNPFLSRFSDRTGLKDSIFLSMYAPQIVRKILAKEHLILPKATWLIGTPGSGKSSILRLFTVDILTEIIRNKVTYSHIYDVLSEFKIIDSDYIKFVGLFVSIDEYYKDSANVRIQNVNNERLLCTLFDLRVAKELLSTIEKLNIFRNISLEGITIKGIPSGRMPPRIFANDSSLPDFVKSIQRKEIQLASLMNSFPGSPIPEELELHNHFSSFDLLSAQMKENDVELILMIDDVHDLYPDQFKYFTREIERRNTFPRWITTRKHIFPISRLLGYSENTTHERETVPIDLDHELADRRLYKRFIKMLVDKRLKLTASLNEFNSDQIEGMLLSEEQLSKNLIVSAQKKQREKAKELKKRFRYSVPDLDEFADGKDISPEMAELLLIKTNRMANKRQLLLFPDLDADSNNFLSDIASKDKQAAKLFWKNRANLSLFAGFDDVIAASDQNVEQFLRIFSPFIDRMIYRVELDKNVIIEPKEQMSIFRKNVRQYIDNVIMRLNYGDKIYRLVENLGNFYRYKTYEPNAPHAPGITQFAFVGSDIERLKVPRADTKDWVVELSKILTVAISNNVFIPENAQKQGARGSELKHRFSFNRLLCINYSLPLQKGDFQILPLQLIYDMCHHIIKPEEVKRRKRSNQLKLLD